MQLTLVSLPVDDVTVWADFWSRTLGLEVHRDPQGARVQVGRTVLELRGSGGAGAVPHHLAVTVTTGGLGAAKAWLAQRATVLEREGQDEFEGPSGWSSRSVYFDGPEHSVLELIERRELPASTPPPGPGRPFGTADLRGLSEVGLAVDDVRGTAARLADEAGVLPYANPATDSFAAVGDVHGLLILVRPGRPWLPTSDRLAAGVVTRVAAAGTGGTDGAAGPRPGRHRLPGGSELWVGGAAARG